MKCLHNNGYIHRDIKPENIFYSLNNENQRIYKIGDYGLTIEKAIAKSICGTPVIW